MYHYPGNYYPPGYPPMHTLPPAPPPDQYLVDLSLSTFQHDMGKSAYSRSGDSYGHMGTPYRSVHGGVLPAERSGIHTMHTKFNLFYGFMVGMLLLMIVSLRDTPALSIFLSFPVVITGILGGCTLILMRIGNQLKYHSEEAKFVLMGSPVPLIILLNIINILMYLIYVATSVASYFDKCALFQAAMCQVSIDRLIPVSAIAIFASVIHLIIVIYYRSIKIIK
jgi:hypothetical protein